MKKLFASLVLSMAVLFSFVSLVKPIFAEDDYDYYGTTYTTTDASSYTVPTFGALLLGGAMVFFYVVVGLGSYVFLSLALMKIAQKMNYKSPWYAWVPILNMILLFELGDKNPNLLWLLLIPGIGAFIVGIIEIIAIMNICEKRGHDKMLGLLTLVPVANYILFGILAWGKENNIPVAPETPVATV